MWSKQERKLRRAYGFDEVSVVPGQVTINPDQANIEFPWEGFKLSAPILAAAMDAVVSPAFAVKFDKIGGLAVMNLEGVQTKYDDPDSVIAEIVEAPEDKVTTLLQKVYSAPAREDLIGTRVEEIKSKGATCAVSVTPAFTEGLAPSAVFAASAPRPRRKGHGARGGL